MTFLLVFSNFVGIGNINIVKAAGAGTWELPYSVTEAIPVQDNRIATVQGYIVGQPTSEKTVLFSDFDGDTAFAIADSKDEKDVTKMLYVQLPKTPSELRANFGLKTNPTAAGKYVKLTGNLTPYFTPHPGLKSTTKIEEVSSVQILLKNLSLPEIVELTEGDNKTIAVSYDPIDTTEKGVNWNSADETIATVADGKITGVKAGETTITATSKIHSDIKASTKVVVKSIEDKEGPTITRVVPADGETVDVNTQPEAIRVEFSDVSGVNENTIKLILDGTALTSVEKTATSISYKLSTPLSEGSHYAKVELSDTKGNPSTREWSFTVGKAAQKQYNLYYGQLHAHTSLSDGVGTPDEAYEWAKNNAKADYVAITDHSNWFDNDKASENITDVSQSTSTEWKQLHTSADKYTENGKFVGIAGFEMTWSGSTGGWGHINTFNTPWFASRSNSAMDLKTYYNKIAGDTNSISQLNHPGKTFGDFADFGFYSVAADNVVNMVEVGNGEGPVRGSGYFPSYEYYTRALDKGWHLAPTNNQDNHKGKWVNANTARTVMLAEDLTRDSLYDAMRNRRIYSTEDENLKIFYTVNDKPMGSILSNTGSLNAKIKIEDPDLTDKIGKVSIIVNGGAVAVSKTFDSNIAEWNLTLPEGNTYYYVKVDQSDKDIAVTAPVWVGSVVPVGISKLEVSQNPQIVNNPVDITATVYNNGTTELKDVKVEFFEGSIDAEHKIGEGVIASVASALTSTTKTTWTPKTIGEIKLYAKTTITIDGKENNFTNTTSMSVGTAEELVKVVIDGGHYNQYVSGDYKGKMLTLADTLQQKGFMLVQNNDELTASDLEHTKVLIITDPQSKDDSKYGLYKSKFTDAEIEVIKNFVKLGGNLIITSRADYNDKGVTDPSYQSAAQGNTILEAIGSNLRFNDDEVIDKTSNGGQEFRLYFNNYTSSKYNLTNNILDGYTYSAYSGCSVILKQNGDESAVDWLVKGLDTTEILDSDLQNDAVPVEKGNVYSLAAEKFSNGSKVVVAGTTFFSDFETAGGDNAYSNKQITENVISWMSEAAPAELKTIAEVRVDADKNGVPDNLGKRFAIEGIVTAQSEAVSPKNAFFEVVYVQDATGGITVFGVSKTELKLGQKVRVTGYVDAYGGDSELQVANEIKDVQIIDTSINPVAPKAMSTADSMKDENEGWLVKVEGKVTKIDGQNIFVNDGTGEARAYVEGYINDGSGNTDKNGKWDSSIIVGDRVSVIGLASEDPEGHRLRIRNTTEIVRLTDTVPPVITITGLENDGVYKETVTPVVSVDKGTYSMTLNGDNYYGTPITDENTYILVVTAVNRDNYSSQTIINFIIDKTAPVISISGVEDSGTYNRTVTPLVSVNEGSYVMTLNDKLYNGEEIKEDGSYVLSVEAVDKAGNRSNVSIKFIIDTTAPEITVSGNKTEYKLDETVNFKFSASDNLTGVLLLSIVDYKAEAYNLSIGKNIVTVEAIDKAGNKAVLNVEFEVKVTYDSLGSLTERFANKKNPSLVNKLQQAKSAEGKGNLKQKEAMLKTYISEVKVQRGKMIDTDKADLLVKFAEQL